MGFGKKLKKVAKAAVRTSAAMMTMGGSELYGAYNDASKEAKQASGELADYQQSTADQNMQAFGYGSIGELIEAQKRKNAELEEKRKTTGIASLIGKGTTLG